jgi:hypothetical protein
MYGDLLEQEVGHANYFTGSTIAKRGKEWNRL